MKKVLDKWARACLALAARSVQSARRSSLRAERHRAKTRRVRNDARDRELLRLRLLDGMTVEQLAEKMDMPVDTAKRRLRRAQRRLFDKAGA